MITTSAAYSIKSPSHLNEDRYREFGDEHPLVKSAQRGRLFAVMDGVGGSPMGMRAAQHIADRLADFFRPNETAVAGPESLVKLLTTVNEEINAWGLIPGTQRSNGAAAATVVWFSPDRKLYLFHIGDTEAYAWDGKSIRKLNTTSGTGRVISQFYGEGPTFNLEVHTFHDWEIEEGDWICLVTDGVTKSMTPSNIAAVFDELPEVGRAAKEVVECARRLGSRDDITAVIVELEEW